MATRKHWLQFRNESADKPAKITIEGEIGGWWDGNDAASFRAQIAGLGETQALNVHIMSGGGSIFEGNEIANILRGHKGEITVTLGSICASIATVIACAGSKVTAAQNTMFMIHDPSVYTAGDSSDLRKTADVMDKMKAGIVSTYAEKTGKSKDELGAMMTEETWMTADEAKAAGFVDSIEGEAEDEIVDGVDLSHYKNVGSLFSRLQKQFAPGNGAAESGNGNRLTIRAIKNAAALENPAPKPANPNPQNQNPIPETMDPLELKKKIDEGVKAALEARNKRNKEIADAVAAVLARDKKDFSPLAKKYLDSDDESAVTNFFRELSTSKDYTTPKNEIVGSGIEVVDPIGGLKGTPGYRFVNSEQFRALGETLRSSGRRPQGGIQLQIVLPDVRNVHTTAATSGSGLTSIEKLPGVVELGVRPLTVEDLIAGGQTGNETIRYIQEVTFTEAAASVAETGALPELAMTYQEVDAPVKDVGGYIKMSENLMMDFPAVASFINTRLPYQVDRGVEEQLLNGDGTGTNITGILSTAGIQTLAKGANTAPDLALKLQTLVRWQNMTAGQAQGGFEPDGYIIHPTDWETLVLLKDANGQYMARGPFTGAYGNPSEFNAVGSIVEFYTLWGKKVVISPVIAQGTMVCAAWKMGAQKFDRQGLVIEMTNSDGSDFLSRKVTVRGTRRLALATYRPGCFVTGTGL